MTDIASEINKKYVECIPDLVTTNKLLDTIRSTCSTVNHSINSIASNVESIAKEIELNVSLVVRLFELPGMGTHELCTIINYLLKTKFISG